MRRHELAGFVMVALVIETLLGFLTFTGSLMAMGKLQEILPSRPMTSMPAVALLYTSGGQCGCPWNQSRNYRHCCKRHRHH